MANLTLQPSMIETELEARSVRYAPRPITLDEFLDLTHEDDNDELVNGVIEDKMAAQLNHEMLFAWLSQILGLYAVRRKLGIVLGSRTLVAIDQYNGRLPDVIFVREENRAIVQQKAIYGAPDLIIEIVSPNDRPSEISRLEANYRTIGVPEIVFVDCQAQRVRIVRKRDADYDEETITRGDIILETMGNVILQAEWLLHEPRPDAYDTLHLLLAS